MKGSGRSDHESDGYGIHDHGDEREILSKGSVRPHQESEREQQSALCSQSDSYSCSLSVKKSENESGVWCPRTPRWLTFPSMVDGVSPSVIQTKIKSDESCVWASLICVIWNV